MSLRLESPHSASIAVWFLRIVLLYALWSFVKAFRNLYIHPLSKFPGPRLAAASGWWRPYVELICGRSFALELTKLHEQYGDIVRIGPDELHFSKPSVYNEIYNPKNRWTKDEALYHVFAIETSTFSLCEYNEAKKRRDVILPLFSRKSIIGTQHLVQECLDKMCDNIADHVNAGKPFNMYRAFRCSSVDTIFSICFARSMHALNAPEFRAPIERAMYTALPNIMLFKHIPPLQALLAKIPPKLVAFVAPEMKGYLDMIEMLKSQVRETLANPQSLAGAPHRTIYHEFFNAMEEHRLSLSEQSLRDEALLFVNAGTDTVSDALSVGTLNVLDNPEVYAKLRAELTQAWPNLDKKPHYETLESLPYLKAVVKESLRFSHGVVHPMPRIVPEGGTQLSGEYIPGGTVVSISNIFVHRSEDIFPEPYVFKPERWLGTDGDSLDMWLVSFSKGPRSCLGTNLAYCEMYMTLAYLFRRFDLRLDGVRATDWRWTDYYLPHYEGPELNVWAEIRTT